MLEVKQVTYQYRTGADVVDALRGVSAEFYPGTLYAIMGRSGSGKSTLLSLLAGMDLPLSGEILINGEVLSKLDRDKYRREIVGMIFQSYYLLPHLTAAENISLAMELSGKYKGVSKAERNNKIDSLLCSVGLTPSHGKKRATRLSGGEQQRIAIARTLGADPEIILADEPTGNLDNENSAVIISILKELAHDSGKCVIVVTHSDTIAAEADVVLHMADGRMENKRS